jgi:dolichyl-diphosphooligosaccharide--protein glycosyltransferase
MCVSSLRGSHFNGVLTWRTFLPFQSLRNKRGAQDGDDNGDSNRLRKQIQKLSPESIDQINEKYESTEMTSAMWEYISQGKLAELAEVLENYPQVAHLRSEDGRGPMWWAYEYKRPRVIDMLKKLGVSDERTDRNGVRAKDVGK